LSRPVKQPRRSDLSDHERDVYDSVVRRHYPDAAPGEERELGSYYGAVMHSPGFSRLLDLGATVVRSCADDPRSFSHADREFANQVLSADLGTNCLQSHHLPEAVAVGVRLEAIKALRYRAEEALTDEERLLAAFIRGVVAGTISDKLWDSMLERLDLRGTVEYALFITYVQMTIRNIQTLIGEESSNEEIDQLIRELEGTAGSSEG
jgi:hypothetical protein